MLKGVSEMKKNLLKFTRIFLIWVLFVGLLTGCSSDKTTSASPNFSGTNPNNNETNKNNKNENYSSSELEKKITSNGAITDCGKLVVFVSNNNKVPVDMEIEVEFYDANGTFVGSDSGDLLAVGSNGNIAVEIWSTPESFDNYKIYVDAEQTDEISYYNDIEISHSNNGEEIAVQAKNNSQDEIEYITVSVVYYQGEKVVGIASDIQNEIKSGRSANFTLNFPYDKKYHDVKFDNYKVFLNGAYSYNW